MPVPSSQLVKTLDSGLQPVSSLTVGTRLYGLASNSTTLEIATVTGVTSLSNQPIRSLSLNGFYLPLGKSASFPVSTAKGYFQRTTETLAVADRVVYVGISDLGGGTAPVGVDPYTAGFDGSITAYTSIQAWDFASKVKFLAGLVDAWGKFREPVRGCPLLSFEVPFTDVAIVSLLDYLLKELVGDNTTHFLTTLPRSVYIVSMRNPDMSSVASTLVSPYLQIKAPPTFPPNPDTSSSVLRTGVVSNGTLFTVTLDTGHMYLLDCGVAIQSGT